MQDFVCEVTQSSEDTPASAGSRETTRVRGGTTIVLRHDGRMRFAIAKELHKRRAQAADRFANGVPRCPRRALCAPAPAVTDLRALHRGY